MKLAAIMGRSLQAEMGAELRDIERAVATGTRQAGAGLKGELRQQVISAGLGGRLANAWRDRHYPNQKVDAASLVWTKAPGIIRAFAEGVTIRSRRGRWLAIPTENAPWRGTDGKRISPSTFPEHRLGRLRLVARPGKVPLLVVDGLRASTGRRGGFRRASARSLGSGQGLVTAVMFVLVPQVTLRKRLDVEAAGRRWHAHLPRLVLEAWPQPAPRSR
jgi:hypothetical protein